MSKLTFKGDSALQSLRKSHTARLVLLGGLTVVLLIPISMIRGLIAEREQRHRSASSEVTSKWGNTQTLMGPALVLPYTIRSTKKGASGEDALHTETRNAIFLPKHLKTSGLITTEVRGRGIFEVPVYSLALKIEGDFDKPNLETLGIDSATVDWRQAHLALGISDVRALRSQSNVTWNGSTTEFLPGPAGFSEAAQAVHAPVAASAQEGSYKFAFPLSLNGSSAVYLVPFAEETIVQLRSNSPYPNFQGNWLPTDRTVSSTGFDATWRVSFLGRSYPQMWISGASVGKSIEGSRFGVALDDPIDQYRMADRSVKYAGLYILLTFTTIWLVEVLSKSSVHPIQYLMVGAALCIFYLLELSLSEHIHFSLAYGTACLAIVSMVAAYGRSLFRRGNRGVAIPVGVALLYTYLYVLLTNEDAALLVGAIGLFAILAAIMFVTRGVDWSGDAGAGTQES